MRKLQVLTLSGTASLLLASMLLCSGCRERDKFIVKGHISSAKEGDTIFLQQRKGNILETIDTSLVHKGQFLFKNYNDSVMAQAVTYTNGDRNFFIPFISEPGTVTINLKDTYSIGGTPLNNQLQNYYQRLQTLQKQQDFFTHRLPPYTLLNKNSALIAAKVRKLTDECNRLVFETIYKNHNNPIAIIILLRDNYLLNSTQIEELTAMLPQNVQKLPKIHNLQKISIEDNHTALGKAFIDFTMPTPQGMNVTLRYVIQTHRLTFIDFWASWCIPCCKELPAIEKLYKKYKAHGLTVLGVSLDTDTHSWNAAIYKYGLTYQQLSDLKGFNSPVSKAYNIRSIPHNYLINSSGTIVGKNIATTDLENALKKELLPSSHSGRKKH